MNKPVSWELLSSFLAVARTGSLSAAARAQRTAQPTVRRHIESLEAELSVVLFTRSQTGLAPTDAARQILPYAEAMASTAEALVRAASADGTVGGTVRVTGSEIMAAEVLPAVLAPVLARWPALEVELSGNDRNEDILRRDADVAVRMVRPTQDRLIARRVGATVLGLFASRAYLDRHAAPESLGELFAGHRLVGEDRKSAMRDAFTAMGAEPGMLRFGFRSDTDSAQLAAIEAGVGIGVCQTALAGRRADLCRVLSEVELQLELWVVTHEDLRDQPRIRVVFDQLVEGLTRYLSATGLEER